MLFIEEMHMNAKKFMIMCSVQPSTVQIQLSTYICKCILLCFFIVMLWLLQTLFQHYSLLQTKSTSKNIKLLFTDVTILEVGTHNKHFKINYVTHKCKVMSSHLREANYSAVV